MEMEKIGYHETRAINGFDDCRAQNWTRAMENRGKPCAIVDAGRNGQHGNNTCMTVHGENTCSTGRWTKTYTVPWKTGGNHVRRTNGSTYGDTGKKREPRDTGQKRVRRPSGPELDSCHGKQGKTTCNRRRGQERLTRARHGYDGSRAKHVLPGPLPKIMYRDLENRGEPCANQRRIHVR
jgi:hypothetical protein